MHRQLRGRTLEKGNRPSCENGEHNGKADKVRRVKKKPPILRLPKDSRYERIEKYEVKRAFRQEGQSEKNRRRHPNEPRRFFLRPKAQPKIIARPESDT